MAPEHPPADGLSPVEGVKASSRHLRGDLAAELVDGTDRFSADGAQLLKFHGVYQQDDRDRRRARKQAGQDLAYSCMVRTSVPGGVLTAGQWLAMDGLADEVGNGTLRVTTRQGVQFHFTAKHDVPTLIGALNAHLVTTTGACGDVVRNVMCCPAPLADRRQEALYDHARRLAQRFRPRSRAYWELWIAGDRAVTAEAPEPAPDEEPIYGDAYLPRKFKIGVAWPGDNCVDIYTHDVGVVPTPGPDGAEGFVVLVGGGLGQSHADEDTHPRLASPLAWVAPDDLGDTVEAVVTAQRDHGNRRDRKQARLKYLVEERGLPWFRAEVEARLGRALDDPPAPPPWRAADDHLGWHAQPDGRWFLGVHVPSGRVQDRGERRLRAALRTAVARFTPGVRLTPSQDVLLTDVAAADRPALETVLRDHGVPLADELAPVRRHGLACPALPTCGLALAEAERAMPGVLDTLEAELERAGLGPADVHVRMTGCPNGCARPYTAEVGIVGRTKSGYDLYVGGSPVGDRLGEQLARGVKLTDLGPTLAPVLARWRDEGGPEEAFGDFCARVGAAASAPAPVAVRRRPERGGHPDRAGRVPVPGGAR